MTTRHSREATIGGWSVYQFARLAKLPTLVVGALGVGLLLFQVKIIILWALVIALFIVLGIRVVHRGGREIHLATIGWSVGVPLGLVFGLAQLLAQRTSEAAFELVRFPILTALVAVLVTSATGYARLKRITARHLLFGERHPVKRHSA